jgi:hypothetical protein
MNLYSLKFLLLLFACAAAFFLLPGARPRRLAFAAEFMAILYSYMPNALSWAVLLAFLLSGFRCALVLRKWPNRVVFAAYLVLLVSALATLKRYDFVTWCVPQRLIELPLAIVGLSCMLFRQIHFIVDIMQGQIDRPTSWSYLTYQLNPFTLLAGPIQRYQDIQAYRDRPAPVFRDQHGALKAYMRLFAGIIKVVLVSEVFRAVYDGMLGQLDGEAPAAGERPLSSPS